MGIRAIVEVLDHAPPELTPAERLILVAIAENINDNDPKRETWPGFNTEVLCRRTGLGPNGLRRAQQRLASRGLEVRVQIGVDKDGNPLFAIPNVQARYRLPRFVVEENPQLNEGGTQVPPPGEGGTPVPPKVVPEYRLAVREYRPTPHSSDSPHSSLSGEAGVPTDASPPGTERDEGSSTIEAEANGTPPSATPSASTSEANSGHERVIMEVLASHGVTVEEMREMVILIKRENHPRSLPAYIRALARNGDLEGYLHRVRADAAQRAARRTPPPPPPSEPPRATPEDRDAAIAQARATLHEIQARARRDRTVPVRLPRPRPPAPVEVGFDDVRHVVLCDHEGRTRLPTPVHYSSCAS